MADDIPFVDQEELPDTNYDLRGEINNFNHENLVAGLGIRPVVVLEGSSHQTVPQELILAVFVVHFDTRKGNIIEWQYPEDINLSEVEFKAMASGSHTITQDFIYFKTKDNYYGLSCFERISVDNIDERGARMKSVGILCARYTSLHEHMSFLEQQVRKQLRQPGHYEELLEYYENYKHCVIRNNVILSPTIKVPGLENIPVLKITHPAGCFPQFIKYFGENIFVLWKFVLLQKRILFFSPPPVGVTCYRVYCACLLASHGIPFGFETGSNPLFFTNVCDLASLHNEHKYIACTTEKIFETKLEVYDVYVDSQVIRCKPHLSCVGTVNFADRDRFIRLERFRAEQLYTGGEVVDDEKMYTRFFVNLNNSLFQTLYEVASTEDRILKPEQIHKMGLDTRDDLNFLSDLVELYGINVHIPQPTCCPFS